MTVLQRLERWRRDLAGILESGMVSRTFCRCFSVWNGGTDIITPFQRLEFCRDLFATVPEILFLKNSGAV
jgi:hypothetical protein